MWTAEALVSFIIFRVINQPETTMASSATVLVDKMASGFIPDGGSTNSVSSDAMVVKWRKKPKRA
jgi:hypothetical protein